MSHLRKNPPNPIKQPLYHQVAQDIIKKIYDGVYRPGMELESIRTLAGIYGVGRQVIVSAIWQLSMDNYVYSEPHKGVFVNPDLRCGRFYRIGFFSNNYNLAILSHTLNIIYKELHDHGYLVIPGSNFEADFSCVDWLKSNSQLDGLFLAGEINESVLRPVAKLHIPYLVLGNYDIAENHPAYKVDVAAATERLLKKRFSAFSGQRVTVILGTPTRRAERELAQAFRLLFRKLGISGSDSELVMNCRSNGYEEISAMMCSARPPDIIYIHGAQAAAWNKYCKLNPGRPRPRVIIHEMHAQSCDSSTYDEKLDFALWDDNDRRAMAGQLIEMVEKH